VKRFFLLVLTLWGLVLSSCLEAEVDINVKRDGTGEMKMKILPLDRSLNPLINELETDLKKKQNYRDSDITKKVESDGRTSLFVRKKFNRVEEADQNCKFVSHKEYDEFIMNIPHDFLGIVKKIKVNMPGTIIESNVKNFEGKSLIWDRTSSSANRLIIKSKPAWPLGNTILIAIILIVGIGIVAAIFIFKNLRSPRVKIQGLSFCPECGTKVNSEDNFCQGCGQSLR
jgi:hypothetical protein